MTYEEAKLFFPYNEEEDLSGLYDERLFEYKQFFLSKTPIRKVFESRLNKLVQMDTAYHILTNNKTEAEEYLPGEEIHFSDVILEAFSQWEQLKGKSKQQIMRSQDASTLKKNVLSYLHITDNYRSKWYTDQDIDIQIDQISKDEDPMEVLEAIKLFEKEGGINFEDILKLNTNSFLLKEMKRLSLLVKNYGNGRSI